MCRTADNKRMELNRVFFFVFLQFIKKKKKKELKEIYIYFSLVLSKDNNKIYILLLFH